ncbi:conserved hypothetical protein [Candida dubliniensis CD36]|uniref:USP domain-containing protein n=1 Tax=Candida dubliniensis (strain CD36 / ATCC MYA-646 / CBS 7987 / NCPF 3949 / NRRL Y-17841) TaxID=573826 RepID=B9W9R2_CANDC|nr:conserved hypothetical protein [Candida dubliniensis CD36]CAX45547.1 conserved hypothetical protein [Candida dubliniensis CD36]
MFKIFSRPNNNSESNTPPGSPSNKIIFADSFWSWYIDSYLINDNQTHIKHTPYNITKYSDKSHDVTTLQKYFITNKLTPIPSTTQIIAILKSPFTQGDLNKSYYLIRMFQLSSQGLFLTNSSTDKLNHSIQFLGAENWDNVMCYLDALLFAMFANLESFEPILFIPNHSEYLLNQLSALLRVYVNLLRSGNLITTDLTAKICEALMKLGFTEALSHKQQDSATLFEFLTQTLNMPLLTFKIDIKHGGKFSKNDDEKISKERILFVSIPNEEIEDELLPVEKGSISHTEKVDKKSTTTTTTTQQVNDEIEQQPQQHEDDEEEEEDSILLEECLEHYFNNSISVKRELERRATLSHITEGITATNINDDEPPRVITTPMSNKYEFETIENIDIDDKTRLRSNSVKSNNVKVGVRQRSSTTLSFWSVGTGDTKSNKSNNDKSRRGSTSGKEVSLPAWMFLRLLPFYTDDNVITNELGSIVKTSKEFATRRPILPICLKRYRFNSGAASGTRSQKRIIIPPFIDLPQFVADDIDDSSCSFRLILESAICHRGDKIESGHFIAVVRKHTNKINETEQEANNSTWYLYDDMKKNSRVVEKTFTEIFKDEWPYMLFYRLVSNHEVSGASSIDSNIVPPQGSKGNYWSQEETTAKETPSPAPAPAPTAVATENNLSVKTQPKSVPISNVSPIDPKYVDIRNKYYWYFTDDDKNYYREEPIKLKDGNSSFTLSPQFRRNSQWSVNSNISFVQLDKEKKSISTTNNSSTHTITSKNSNFTKSKTGKSDNDDSNPATTSTTTTTSTTKQSSLPNKENENKSPHSSIWKRAIKMTTSPSVKVDSTESVGELNKQISPINLDSSNDNANTKSSGTTSPLPKTLRNLENNQKKHRHPFSHKKSKTKRQDDYKKEHCIMM